MNILKETSLSLNDLSTIGCTDDEIIEFLRQAICKYDGEVQVKALEIADLTVVGCEHEAILELLRKTVCLAYNTPLSLDDFYALGYKKELIEQILRKAILTKKDTFNDTESK